MKEQTLHSLALALVPGIGRTRLRRLIEIFGDAAGVTRLPRERLRRLGIPPEARAAILSGKALSLAEEETERAKKAGVRVLSPWEGDYPKLLREIHDPPLVLYAKGDLETLRLPSVAIVGSRRCSVYGREISLMLARELASLGLLIVSGLARGIDSKAHQGALEAGGKTAAVLGSGVDVVYPKENRRLYERIAESGCVLSEFPMGTYPAPQNFPVRNRIISGLCYGTVITEASEFSGSLITARLTLEQDRELWAVPGNVTNPGSYGPNYLIKQGAKPIITAQDVVDELPLAVLEQLRPREDRDAQEESAAEMNPAEKRVLQALPPDQALHFDRLLELTGLGQAELNQALLALEMAGQARQMPGRRFSRRLL